MIRSTTSVTIVVLLLCTLLPMTGFGQTVSTAPVKPTSPAASVPTTDLLLGDQDVQASADAIDARDSAGHAALLTDLGAQYQVPADQLQALTDQGLKAHEIWLALELAKTSGKSLNDVAALATAKTNGKPGQDWNQVAKSLGVTPGSNNFAALKADAIASAKADKAAVKADKAANKAADKADKGEKGGDKGNKAGNGSGSTNKSKK